MPEPESAGAERAAREEETLSAAGEVEESASRDAVVEASETSPKAVRATQEEARRERTLDHEAQLEEIGFDGDFAYYNADDELIALGDPNHLDPFRSEGQSGLSGRGGRRRLE